jgi:integrase/recombinase XerD
VVPQQASTDAQLCGLWLHGRPQTTRRAYLHYADDFARFCGAPLQAVTVGHVQGYADDLAGRGLAAGTQASGLTAVKSLLSFAHRIGYTAFNVGAVVQLPPRKDTLAERIVPAATVRLVVDGEPNPRNRLLLRLLYLSGCRVSELCGLRWRDLQAREDSGQVTVYGKGGKTRAIPLPADLWRDLQAVRGGDDGPVFAGRGGALTASGAWRVVKAAGKRAGVPGLSPHWMRHALASHALDNGAPIHVVRDTLGHASAATTSRYLHARPGDSASLYVVPV